MVWRRICPLGGGGLILGIDYAVAQKLIALAGDHGVTGDVLMLGRQSMKIKDRFRDRLDDALLERQMGYRFDALEQPDGFAETMFKKLGADSVVSMDFSDFEGAQVTHDLNAPVPADLEEKYDVIFDGGTTEHIFDVASSMDNINRMLAPGGLFISAVPANNWFGHGFYQFGPELVYSYWKHGCGFDVLDCVMLPVLPRDKELPLQDAAELGHRLRLKGKVPRQRTFLYYVVRKGTAAHRWNRALQTDYVNRWSAHDAASGRAESDTIALRQAQAGGG